jgi:hypothetical protein
MDAGLHHKEVTMMTEGDAPEGQPAEGVATLSGLANMLDSDDAPAEVPEGEEEGAEAEEVEGDEAEGDEPDEPQEEATFTIKHDGKEVNLKQSELVELAQKGFDYTHKTMAVAEEKKAVDAAKQEAAALSQQYQQALGESIARLQAFTEFMEGQIGEPPSIELAHQNAAHYLALKEAHESQRGKLHQAYQQLHHLQQQQAQERQAQLMRKATETERALADTLPGWKDDPEKALNDLNSYLGTVGLTPQNAADAFTEVGLWTLAHKAREYDRLQAEKAKLTPKTDLPRVQKPLATNQPPQLARRQEAMRRHKSAPSLSTLAELL